MPPAVLLNLAVAPLPLPLPLPLLLLLLPCRSGWLATSSGDTDGDGEEARDFGGDGGRYAGM